MKTPNSRSGNFAVPLFRHPDPNAPTVECPNFFQLGKQWVLFVSPYGRVQYFTGDFDAASCRFTAHARGLVDYGASFYAPNTMQVPDGRRLVWGWLNGFPGGHGWNGCLSLPRQLSLARDGQLRQIPAPQLAKLRGKPVEWRHLRLSGDGETLRLPEDEQRLSSGADIRIPSAKRIALELKSGSPGATPLVLTFDGAQLTVLDSDGAVANFG